jgi:hypothetical protein
MNLDRAGRMGKGRFGRFIGFWLLAWLVLASAPAAWGSVRYVKADATGANTGASWADAYPSPQTALAVAQSGDEIWVAAGTYKPTTLTDRTISFVMAAGVGIYGGFSGTETARDQRNWTAHATILSGDIGTSGTATDNTYHVVVGANGVLDGFTITGGYATDRNGGGMINDSVSPTVANCTFTGNSAVGSYLAAGYNDSALVRAGGGMYNTNASPVVTNCTFTSNQAVGSSYIPSYMTYSAAGSAYGGGMYNTNSSSATVTSCAFTSNSAIGGTGNICIGGSAYGAGMYNDASAITVTDCTFTNNSGEIFEPFWGGGTINGGGMCGGNAVNCTFTGNTTSGMSDGTATNCAFTENTGCGVSGGTATNCTFTKNSYGMSGGTATNCEFTENTSCGMSGGTATNCAFTENTGCGMSGGTASNCMFVNNKGTGSFSAGGGMNGGSATNCVFVGNEAAIGGGMSGGNATNCVFTMNTASYHGGGMAGGGSLINCTFIGNTAGGAGDGAGGGLYTDGIARTLTNCIFWNNSAKYGYQVYAINKSTGAPTFKNCDVQGCGGSGAQWYSWIGTDGGGNINIDPLFVDAATPAGPDGIWRTADDGLRLRDGSPCINVGTTDGAPTTDILGHFRIGLPDMGAYEDQTLTAAEQWTLYR